MRSFPLALAALAALVTACSTLPLPPGGIVAPSRNWRLVATAADRARLAGWRSSLVAGLAEGRAAGHGAEIDREGILLAPDLPPRVAPLPNGPYRCRTIKLGHRSAAGGLDYIVYPPFECRVGQERDVQGFAKTGGSQRPIGLVFPDSPTRQLFLGTLTLGDERAAMLYGHDAERDLAAWVEPLGDGRWRMVFPDPAFESRADVIELVPAR